jgi:hypothetical protein
MITLLSFCLDAQPKSSSVVQGVVAWFTGQRPEFFDPKFVSQGEGREGEPKLFLFF